MTPSKGPSLLPVLGIAALAGILTLAFLFSLRADTPVVVAAHPVAVGARLAEGDLTVKLVRQADALPGALTTIEDAVGQVISTQRLPGDQITAGMLGSQALSAIAASLEADHRAVAVKVTRSSGLAGILRPGDFVTLIAVVAPDAQLRALNVLEVPDISGATATPGVSGPAPTATTGYGPIVPESPFARVTASGLKVLLVPQTFRYEEVTTSGADSQGFALAQSSLSGQQESVIVLDVPVTPVTVAGIDGPMRISLPELIALLDAHARVYLALEPASQASPIRAPGVAIEQIINLGVGQ
jgi:Flp pilus assembly protein CpaB